MKDELSMWLPFLIVRSISCWTPISWYSPVHKTLTLRHTSGICDWKSGLAILLAKLLSKRGMQHTSSIQHCSRPVGFRQVSTCGPVSLQRPMFLPIGPIRPSGPIVRIVASWATPMHFHARDICPLLCDLQKDPIVAMGIASKSRIWQSFYQSFYRHCGGSILELQMKALQTTYSKKGTLPIRCLKATT